MTIKVKKLSEEVILPSYQTTHSAGADIRAFIDNDIEVKPGEIVLIPTGLIFEIPEGYEVQIRPRSGLSLKGIVLPNSPGTIDSDYRGEIKIILMNIGKEPYTIHKNDRIAQMVISKYIQANFQEVDELSQTKRGEGGFGSTGVN